MAKKTKKRSKRKKTTIKKKGVKRKKVVRRKSRASKSKPKRRKAKIPFKGPELPAEPLGRVTHYFPKVRATALMIERDSIQVGDVLYFKGHTTHFKQKIESMQINHQPVTQASEGDEIGIRTKSRTREHDRVFKL